MAQPRLAEPEAVGGQNRIGETVRRLAGSQFLRQFRDALQDARGLINVIGNIFELRRAARSQVGKTPWPRTRRGCRFPWCRRSSRPAPVCPAPVRSACAGRGGTCNRWVCRDHACVGLCWLRGASRCSPEEALARRSPTCIWDLWWPRPTPRWKYRWCPGKPIHGGRCLRHRQRTGVRQPYGHLCMPAACNSAFTDARRRATGMAS